MRGATVTRGAILKALRTALEPLDYVHAMGEGGAAAFDRIDEWSDIDLQVDADDDRVAGTFAIRSIGKHSWRRSKAVWKPCG